MNLESLGNIGEFIGGLAVIASLVYLAVQIRQNTKLLRSASRQDIVSGYRAHSRLFLEPGRSRAYAEGLSAYPDMPFDEKSMFGYLVADHAVFFQAVFALHESGTLEDEVYQAYLDWFACHLATPGGSVWWAQIRSILTPRRMVEAVDARLARGGLPDIRELPQWQLEAPRSPSSQADDSRNA